MIDEHNSELETKRFAFVRLEGVISHCAAMAQIVRERVADARIVRADPPRDDDDETVFAVLHLCDLVQDLKRQYSQALTDAA